MTGYDPFPIRIRLKKKPWICIRQKQPDPAGSITRLFLPFKPLLKEIEPEETQFFLIYTSHGTYIRW